MSSRTSIDATICILFSLFGNPPSHQGFNEIFYNEGILMSASLQPVHNWASRTLTMKISTWRSGSGVRESRIFVALFAWPCPAFEASFSIACFSIRKSIVWWIPKRINEGFALVMRYFIGVSRFSLCDRTSAGASRFQCHEARTEHVVFFVSSIDFHSGQGKYAKSDVIEYQDAINCEEFENKQA